MHAWTVCLRAPHQLDFHNAGKEQGAFRELGGQNLHMAEDAQPVLAEAEPLAGAGEASLLAQSQCCLSPLRCGYLLPHAVILRHGQWDHVSGARRLQLKAQAQNSSSSSSSSFVV